MLDRACTTHNTCEGGPVTTLADGSGNGGGDGLVAYGQEPGEVSARADAAASNTRINDRTMDARDARNRRSIMAALLEVRLGRELFRPHRGETR